LIALSIVPPVIVTGAPSGPAMVIDAHCELYRAENPAMRSAFEEATRGRTLVAEWRDEDAAGAPVADVVLRTRARPIWSWPLRPIPSRREATI
jgi:hypothetical protein